MKKLLRFGLLCAIMTLALCVTALADEAEAGVYSRSELAGLTITPDGSTGVVALTSDNVGDFSGAALEDGTVTIYPTATKVTVSYTNAALANKQVLLVATQGVGENPGTPTQGNVAYIDQVTADESGVVTFMVYPSEISKNMTYYISLASDAESGVTTLTEVALFYYWRAFLLGDVNSDGIIDIQDASALVSFIVGNRDFSTKQMKAANTNKSGDIDIQDASLLISVIVGNATLE